ncbi:AMP-dependent synthetase [Marmoricola endophyticus]|uniref:Acyl-CoA synthetase n=1 Tax=Marmoricola endophyticus TaxID=2040280 RepID=A0A917EZJ4_9ACTN|nr:AMP-dependent synthetase/ligase [Marmoricola endophyticus]GGF37151.1 AMP-dependent synthetase [Marmoricola endophyticus]
MPAAPVRDDFDMSAVTDRLPSIAAQFLDRVRRTPSNEAYRFPVSMGGEEVWSSLTWKQAGERVLQYAAGLVALGVEPEQRVAIAAATRYEWILADLAIMCSGAATTTVYPSTNAEDTTYILTDSGSQVVFAEDDDQIAKLRENRAQLSEVSKVITFDGTADGDWVIGLDDLASLGAERIAAKPEEIYDIVEAIGPDDLATLIYTSGTTGKPKGVRLLQGSWTYEGAVIQGQGILDESDLQFLWLPMAHSFGKVLLSAQLACGFPTAVDGRVDKIIDNLAIVKPTFMGAAPRIFEKAYGRIQTMQEAEGGAKKKIFDRAFATGLKYDGLKREGKKPGFVLEREHAVLDKLVFAKVRERFGGRVRFFISGSAALNREIAEWFHAAGILILEGYGLTETSAGAFVNHPDDYKIGTVGPAMPGSEVQIASDGEVLIKGPHVMQGYHNNVEATGEALEDGWMHTGDIGELDEDGFLRITDRKKDLFKTSGGKYVAPSAIEAQFKAICPYVSQFVVHGNERNFVSAIVALDTDAITEWAQSNGLGGKSYAEIVGSDACRAMVQGYVDQTNARLNRWETVKKFIVLDHEPSVETGELTPSMKVKRKVVESNNQAELDALYS